MPKLIPAAWQGGLCALLLVLTPTLQAQTDETPIEKRIAPIAETARRSVRSSTEWLARGVDSWFGDKPFSEGGKVSDGLLSLGLLKRQHESTEFSPRFKARLRLPNLEENAYVFIGRDDQREVVSDKPKSFTNEQLLLKGNADDQSFFAGIGTRLRDSAIDLRLGLRGGLKPYAQARHARQYTFGAANLVELRETVFLTSGDRLGSTSVASYEHAFSSTLAARWLNAATITQRSGKFEWSSSLGAYKSLGQQRLLSLEALVSGRQGSGVPSTDYGLQVKWEQPVHKDWVIGELIFGHFWPRADAASERGQAWAIGGGLKLRF